MEASVAEVRGASAVQRMIVPARSPCPNEPARIPNFAFAHTTDMPLFVPLTPYIITMDKNAFLSRESHVVAVMWRIERAPHDLCAKLCCGKWTTSLN